MGSVPRRILPNTVRWYSLPPCSALRTLGWNWGVTSPSDYCHCPPLPQRVGQILRVNFTSFKMGRSLGLLFGLLFTLRFVYFCFRPITAKHRKDHQGFSQLKKTKPSPAQKSKGNTSRTQCKSKFTTPV